MSARARARALVAAVVLVALALPPRSTRAQAAGPAGLVHEAVTTGRRASVLTLSVGVQNQLVFAKLVLLYRAEGESEFRAAEMKLASPGLYRGEIPVQATLGHTVAYYIEARDDADAPVAGRASAQTPLVIQLAGEAPEVLVAKPGAGDDDDERPSERQFFVGLLVGTGTGWATGNGDTNADTMYKPAAFAPAALGQLSPEVGYWVSRTLMISAQGRFQIVTGTNDVYADGRVYHAASYAAAGFLKATWLASRPGAAHPFFSLAAGYGRIRHVVTFDSLRDCGPHAQDVCVDSIAAGPVAFGPGAGVFVDLGAHLVGVFELDTQLTMPAYSINLDANLGLAVRF